MSCTQPLRAFGLLLAAALFLPLTAAVHAVELAPAAKPRAGAASPARAPRPESQPTWKQLTAVQQQALAPLAGAWPSLGAARKRKWLVVAQAYPQMEAAERERLHARMAEWAAMTPQQRVRARHNFFRAQRWPADERKARWEAYQALSPEEKRKLAATARPPVPPTAAAVQPEPRDKLARVPGAASPPEAHAPNAP